MDGPQKVASSLVVARGNGPVLLQCRIPDDHKAACGTGVDAPGTTSSWPA